MNALGSAEALSSASCKGSAVEPSRRAVLVGRFKVEPLSAARRNDLVGTAARVPGSFNSRIPSTEAGLRSVGVSSWMLLRSWR